MGKVDYWYSDDSLKQSEDALKRAVGQYAANNSWLYVGLTQQLPETRFAQHQSQWADGHKWDRMIVIYKAQSLTLMQAVEDRLINYAKRQIELGKYTCELLNEKDSQSPPPSKNPTGFWVYCLVQK